MPHAFITATTLDSCSVLTLSNRYGLFSYHPNKDTATNLFTLSSNDFLSDNYIYCSSTLFNRYYTLGSLNKGAMLFDKNGAVFTAVQRE